MAASKKQKRRLGRTIALRRKTVYKQQMDRAWRNFCIKLGIINE
ncbi:DUF3983 domain-containing protein [Sutcliffiella halmapala]